MKGYKAFGKGLICRGKQYAENTVFEEDEAVICEKGMHFCKNPLDVLDYYPLIDDKGNMTEFAEVEALDEALTDDEKKFVTKKLKVGAKLSLQQFIKASVEVTYQNIKEEATNKKSKNKDELIKAGGNSSKLAGGDSSTLAGGDSSTLAGGDFSTLAGGYSSTLAGGKFSRLAGGYSSKIAGGNFSTLAGGNSSTLAGGNFSKLASGNFSKLAGGSHSIMVGDHKSIAKGQKGALIVLVERELLNGQYVIKSFKAELVDGEKIKEGTWYKLVNGEFKEVEQ